MMPRIMFVDDDPNILSGIGRLLFSMRDRWHMEFIVDPDMALRLAAVGGYDVIVIDSRMPEINGREMAKRIKSAAPRTICILLSGDCAARSESGAEDCIDAVLEKPCRASELRRVVGSFLQVVPTGG